MAILIAIVAFVLVVVIGVSVTTPTGGPCVRRELCALVADQPHLAEDSIAPASELNSIALVVNFAPPTPSDIPVFTTVDSAEMVIAAHHQLRERSAWIASFSTGASTPLPLRVSA
jgi:hypothetical protein